MSSEMPVLARIIVNVELMKLAQILEARPSPGESTGEAQTPVVFGPPQGPVPAEGLPGEDPNLPAATALLRPAVSATPRRGSPPSPLLPRAALRTKKTRPTR